MKKILPTLLLTISTLTLSSQMASAANQNVVFGGYSFGEDVSYGYLGGATALSGDIEKDGVLLRVGGGLGKYNYSAPSAVGGAVTGQVSSVDLMVGYQQNFDYGRLATYLGANYDNYKLNKADNGNRVTGGKSGAKGQVELLLEPSKCITIQNVTSYTSAYNAYWSQTSIGHNFSKVTFGPEVAFLGNRSFNQQRVGGKFSKIKIALAELYLSAGYMKSSGVSSGDDGAYTSIGLSSKF